MTKQTIQDLNKAGLKRTISSKEIQEDIVYLTSLISSIQALKTKFTQIAVGLKSGQRKNKLSYATMHLMESQHELTATSAQLAAYVDKNKSKQKSNTKGKNKPLTEEPNPGTLVEIKKPTKSI